MANEDKKDFNAMLHDSKDMPKLQIITNKKSIEKYGGDKMYFAPQNGAFPAAYQHHHADCGRRTAGHGSR